MAASRSIQRWYRGMGLPLYCAVLVRTSANRVARQFAKTMNHQGHQGTQRNPLTSKAFVILRVLGGWGLLDCIGKFTHGSESRDSYCYHSALHLNRITANTPNN